MKITDKIYKVDNIKGANSYLVETNDCLIIIDSGISKDCSSIINYITSIGKNPKGLKYILLTHSDIDHVSGAACLRAKTGAKIAIHGNDADVLTGKKKSPKKIKGFQGFMFKIIGVLFMKASPTKPDIILKDGDVISGLLVIHNPGHTPGSVSFFDHKDSVLFSGDALLCDKEGNIMLPRPNFSLNINQANQSAEKLKELSFKILLPGHGKTWMVNAKT